MPNDNNDDEYDVPPGLARSLERGAVARRSSDSSVKVNTALLQLIVWVVTVVLAYAALSTRIAVLETKYDTLKTDLADISSKLDRILEREPR